MYSDSLMSFVCILLILTFSILGGIGIRLFTQGWRKWKPVINFLIFPTLLAQILWGALIRNGIPQLFDNHYRDEYLQYPRLIATTLLLVKIGFELEEPQLRRKSIWIRGLIGAVAEIAIIAIFSNLLLNLPCLYSISLGGLISVTAPASLTRNLTKLKNSPILDKKALAYYTTTLNKSASIVGLLVFEIFKGLEEKIDEKVDPADVCAELCMEILSGVGAAGLMLLISSQMNTMKNQAKIITFTACFFLLNLLITHNKLHITLLLSAVLFGYGVKFLWKESTPTSIVDSLLTLSGPFLFGFVGAQINLDLIEQSMLFYSFAAIICGSLIRFLFGYLFASSKTEHPRANERFVFALSGLCKADCQAVFGGALLWTQNNKLLTATYLNISVLSIIISVGFGAIFNKALERKLNSMNCSRGVHIYETDIDAKGIKELPHYVTEEEIVAPPDLPQERPLEDIVGWASSDNVD